jgi:hypothetical protein
MRIEERLQQLQQYDINVRSKGYLVEMLLLLSRGPPHVIARFDDGEGEELILGLSPDDTMVKPVPQGEHSPYYRLLVAEVGEKGINSALVRAHRKIWNTFGQSEGAELFARAERSGGLAMLFEQHIIRDYKTGRRYIFDLPDRVVLEKGK